MRFRVFLSFAFLLCTFSSCRVQKYVATSEDKSQFEKIYASCDLRDTIQLLMLSPVVGCDSDSVCLATLIRHRVVSSRVETKDSFSSHSTSGFNINQRPVSLFSFSTFVSVVCCLALLCLLVWLWRSSRGLF